MALLTTWKNLLKKVRAPRVAFKIVWNELTALDGRIDDVEAGAVAEGSIDTPEIKDHAITSDKMKYFLSDEQTGTGSAQNVAHGLTVEPALVLIIPSLVGTDGATITFTKGTTNVIVTATTGAKYRVFAMP